MTGSTEGLRLLMRKTRIRNGYGHPVVSIVSLKFRRTLTSVHIAAARVDFQTLQRRKKNLISLKRQYLQRVRNLKDKGHLKKVLDFKRAVEKDAKLVIGRPFAEVLRLATSPK